LSLPRTRAGDSRAGAAICKRRVATGRQVPGVDKKVLLDRLAQVEKILTTAPTTGRSAGPT
jgi:hypothetical protein